MQQIDRPAPPEFRSIYLSENKQSGSQWPLWFHPGPGRAAASPLSSPKLIAACDICPDGDAALVDRAVTTLTYVVGDETKAIAAIFALYNRIPPRYQHS